MPIHRWELRESCNPVMGSIGYTYKYDVSLAAGDFGNFISDVKVMLEDISKASSVDVDLRCVNWGHIIGKINNMNKYGADFL